MSSFGSTAHLTESAPLPLRPLATEGACAAPACGRLELAARDCSQAPNCSDGCYCNYENCTASSSCGIECVNRCQKDLMACLDCCNGKC